MPTILVQNLRGYPRRSRAIGRDVLQTARFGDSSRHSRPHNAITLRSQTIVCGTEFISWVLPSMLEQNLRGYHHRSRAIGRGVPKICLRTITEQPQKARLATLFRSQIGVTAAEFISWMLPSMLATGLKKYHRRSCVQQLWSPRHGGIINKITQIWIS